MNETELIQLFFHDLDKLGPSSEHTTKAALLALPTSEFPIVVDAGCGTGAQTLVLAKELQQVVHAVDNRSDFLIALKNRAEADGLRECVQTHCFDLSDIPHHFPRIDLLWSEGAAYNIGFAEALGLWWRAIVPGGCLVVSELCWLREDVPDRVRQFLAGEYPEMQSVGERLAQVERLGYQVIHEQHLPDDCWIEGYYDKLEPRARSLLRHDDPDVRAFAANTIEEIEVFRVASGCYGYVLFSLQRPN